MGRGPWLKPTGQKQRAAATGRRVAAPASRTVGRGSSLREDNRIKRSGPPCIGSFGGVWDPWDAGHSARAASSWGRVHGPCFSQTF